ncbi:MAG: hypothetical protein GY898_12035 [Proteobacteria bacterium]|nr:hypothetical protein [Pseudomonadota bacterium]
MRFSLLIVAILALSACTPGVGVDSWIYEINLTWMPDLEEGRYAAWAVNDAGDAVLVMEYTTGAGDSAEVSVDPADFDEIIVSIHPSDGQLTEPSAAVFFRAPLEEWGGSLQNEIPVQSVSGSGTMWTPTDGSPDDATSGMWFGADDEGELLPSLLVPVLTEGFRWESWVETDDTVLSMGRFARPDGRDDVCLYCDSVEDPPMVPGEDFLFDLPTTLDSVNLADGGSRTWVTLEPDLEGVDPTGDGSFFTVLARDIDYEQEPGVSIELFGPDMPGILGSVNILTPGYEG